MAFGPTEIVVILVIIVLVWLAFRGLFSSGSSAKVVTQPREIDWGALNDPQIQDALGRGSKIEAIKRYRELTGLGLKESKDAIDYAAANPGQKGDKKKKAAYDALDAGVRDLVRDGQIDRAVELYRQFAGVDEYTAKDAVAEMERELRLADVPTNPEQDPRIRELLQNGNKIEAIKLYRERTGLGLKEAKDAIDAVENRYKL